MNLNNAHITTSALSGLKVIDLTRVLGGPYCTQILADHGADVLKIEPPSGDETRMWGPPFVGNTAAYFVGINRNKDGMSLDLSQKEGRDFLMSLLVDADILVENFKPGTLEKWGIDYQFLKQSFPQLIHCCISGFGADGPLGGLPGYDACAQAMCGLMSVNGEKKGDPLRIGLPVVDIVTGLNAAIAILMAVQERHNSGLGQYLDITLYDCAISLLHPHVPNYFNSGNIPNRTGNDHPNIAPYESYTTGEGEIFLAVGNNRQFTNLSKKLGHPELATDERFMNNADRLQNRSALRIELSQILANFKAQELAQELLKEGVPAAPINNVAELLDHPHTTHRNMVIEHDGYKGINTPIKLSRTPARFRKGPPSLNTDIPIKELL
nr:CoA transferase [Providencia huaxiensis]